MYNTQYKSPGKWGNSILCMNCSNSGHTSKHCPYPITSYGVILVRYTSPNVIKRPVFDSGVNQVEYLLIQRKNSIGFIEVIRGKYKVTDIDYIKKNICGMTSLEKNMLKNATYDELWEAVWGPSTEITNKYKTEKEQGRIKIDTLRSGTPSLSSMIDEDTGNWETPEWGFPKGRKNMYESEIDCAMREMWEETNISQRQIVHIKNLEPISESFTGTNAIEYCHKYFVALVPPDVTLQTVEDASKTNCHIAREVGNMKWVSFEEGIQLIRDENKEKRELLLRVNNLFTHYCPIHLASISPVP